ncbi:MAG: hypothetical protein ABI433_06015, partial [Burkholderiaceae bacterium]
GSRRGLRAGSRPAVGAVRGSLIANSGARIGCTKWKPCARSQASDFLRTNARDEFQGFYFNAPVSAGEFTTLLQQGSPVIS